MRKAFTLIILFFVCAKLHSQEFSVLDKALRKKYPEKKSFVADGKWVYYPEDGQIKKLSFNAIGKLIPNYEYYSANLTNYLDQHIATADCLILLNKKDNSIELIPPVWFHIVSDDLFKHYIGHQFKDKNEIESFIKDIEKVLLIGSEMHLGKTSYEENKVLIRLILDNHDDTWNAIELDFENNKLLNVIANNGE